MSTLEAVPAGNGRATQPRLATLAPVDDLVCDDTDGVSDCRNDGAEHLDDRDDQCPGKRKRQQCDDEGQGQHGHETTHLRGPDDQGGECQHAGCAERNFLILVHGSLLWGRRSRYLRKQKINELSYYSIINANLQ